MHDNLEASINLAESVRYSGDVGQPLVREGSLESSRIHYQFNENGLRLSEDMTFQFFGCGRKNPSLHPYSKVTD